MLFYNIIFAFLLFLRYSLNLPRGQRRHLYYLVLIFLFLLSAFRLDVGCDWGNYLGHYRIQEFSTLDVALSGSDPSWWALIHLVHELGLPYPWLNVLSSIIAFFGIHIFARRQVDPLGFLILLYPVLIINMPMSGIRQGAAIGLMCIAFSAFIDKKLIRFLVFTLIASTIHSSALLFLLLAPLVAGEYSTKRLLLAGVLALPGLLFLMGGSGATEAIGRYVDSGYDAAGAAFRVGLLFVTSLFFWGVLKKKWLVAFPEDYKLAVIGALMMVATLLILPISSIISDRLGYYLIPLQVMILARIPYLPIRKYRVIYMHSSYLMLFLVFFIWTSSSQIFPLCYIPYQSWLFDFSSYFSSY